ncbi:hypothetical protein CO2235_U770015 [Cupriavidus oxalaticus]|uniref:Uncharacterized protein n=1 Tax=Cupriavidus oxalaticus TaxID=96344 RepID=A0A375FTE6_9BURK|nr:hypothetical protein CO2235_U770015 [Cupriavidus oxalaticus]
MLPDQAIHYTVMTVAEEDVSGAT